ncbi:JmjC domain-containing protein 5 [Echinococcus granulosus]|uniref:JmjC domain-containing protein 5 n=1 Tax=Echinococcus granulosus TaxID=6210 RepID=W6UVL0_ECHGR|nr:JmjC domain-containing protein 5 [Echinococcus granulosus]EUB57449.1 JmjC domain-containing protein 5 [Echinococcus granulosus]
MSDTKVLHDQLIRCFEGLLQGVDDVFVRACLGALRYSRSNFYDLVEYAREKLNTGYWRDVPDFWRESYSLLRLASVLSCLSASKDGNDCDVEYVMWLLDDALIMGHSDSLGEVITSLASQANAFLTEHLPTISFPSRYSDVDTAPPELTSFTYSSEVISELERVHQPSIAEFTTILAAGIPVIITGAMSHWPACNEASDHYWSPAYWSKTAGYRTVPIEVGAAYTDESWGQRLVTVNQFFETCILNPAKNQPLGYLAQHQILLQIPELANDVDIPEYCYTGVTDMNSRETTIDSNIWIGPSNTVSPLHHDSDRANLLCQLIGKKYVKLYNADQTEFIYPHVENSMLSNTSQLDVASRQPDFDKFPKFQQARGFHGILGPGEMLFIPPRGWHYIRSLTTSISMNFWCLAKMSNPRSKEDNSFDLEQQFILRMPEEAARYLAEDIDLGVSFKDNFTVEMKPDMRHCIVRYNGQVYQGRVMDLPCIIESQKTTDRKNFYKTADISQMIICTQDDDGTAPIRGSAAYLAARSLHNRPQPSNTYGRDNREFQYLHGITPPLKNVLRRRFRKTRKKRSVDMPQIEKEVKNLLRADLQADFVTWEVVWSEPPSQPQPSATGGERASGEGDKAAAAAALSSSASVTTLDPLQKTLSGTQPLADIDEEAADDTDDGGSV